MSTTSPASVSVLGLGAMGTSLATAFLTAGHPTTVWNRTPARADRLVASGATGVRTAAEAVAASDLTVLCLLDRGAVDAVLDDVGGGLVGATVVNLTSSTPEDARATAGRAEAAGARYLDGKIMVPTPLIGTADALVLYSGDAGLFADHRETLGALGGEVDLVGEDPGRAALYDLGMLDVFFNGMTAFLHAAALVGADGVPASTFLPYADRILEVLRATLPGLAADAERGEHPGDQDNLEMEGAALDHIVHASARRGIDTTVPDLSRALVRSAVARGHGRDGFSRVIDLLRAPAADRDPLAPSVANSL